MKIIKEILGRIWALWGLLSFASTFFIIFIPSMLCYLIPGKKGQDIFIAISRIWMTFWLHIIGCPVTVNGKEYFKKDMAYIVTYGNYTHLHAGLKLLMKTKEINFFKASFCC